MRGQFPGPRDFALHTMLQNKYELYKFFLIDHFKLR